MMVPQHMNPSAVGMTTPTRRRLVRAWRGSAAILRAVMLGATVLGAGSSAASTQQLTLSTAPVREGVELTIYNSEDLTLVRETRTLSIKPGDNRLQFSWANTLIDPTSVELSFPRHDDVVQLLDTSYPQDRPQTLYWNVQSDVATEVPVEISYFTSGLTWSADYVAVADAAETQARLDGFVRVTNHSGEDYPAARVRLVVGTINLVEKIAALARVPVAAVPAIPEGQRGALRQRAARALMVPMALADSAAPAREEKAIIKEGLSEYFIYTVEGQESIPNGWSKRLRSFSAAAVPVQVLYRYRAPQYGDQLVRLYRMVNDTAAGLGETPLPDGIVRVFREHADGGLGFLGQEQVRYVAIGDRMDLNLGADPRVHFELRWLESWRDNLWMQVGKGRVFRRAGERSAVVEHDAEVVGWDAHRLFAQRVHNHTDRHIQLEVRRSYDGDVQFSASLNAKLHDFRTVEYTLTVASGERVDVPYEVMVRNGRNAKQNRVQLEAVEVDATPRRGRRG